jgi:hypothetical protein
MGRVAVTDRTHRCRHRKAVVPGDVCSRA